MPSREELHVIDEENYRAGVIDRAVWLIPSTEKANITIFFDENYSAHPEEIHGELDEEAFRGVYAYHADRKTDSETFCQPLPYRDTWSTKATNSAVLDRISP